MRAFGWRVHGGFREDPASRGVPDEGIELAGGAGGVREEDGWISDKRKHSLISSNVFIPYPPTACKVLRVP